MGIALIIRKLARKGIDVGEMIDLASPDFENHFFVAFHAEKGSVIFALVVCGHNLPV
jgi:hypothetical protein